MKDLVVIITWDNSSQKYYAVCPEMNCIFAYGNTQSLALENIEQAIKSALICFPEGSMSSDISKDDHLELIATYS